MDGIGRLPSWPTAREGVAPAPRHWDPAFGSGAHDGSITRDIRAFAAGWQDLDLAEYEALISPEFEVGFPEEDALREAVAGGRLAAYHHRLCAFHAQLLWRGHPITLWDLHKAVMRYSTRAQL